MIFYCWTALSVSSPESVAMGITDDRGRAMRAGEESLESGQAVTVLIEAVRPAMAVATLAPCYLGTGVGWLGRRTQTGNVCWRRLFPAPSRGPGIPAPPRPRAVAACPALARTAPWQDWGHETADLH